MAGERRDLDGRSDPAVEKRQLERMPLDEQVSGEVMVFQPMTIRDISQTGAQIQTTVPLQCGSVHDFRLSLGGSAVMVRGRVAYCHIGELTDAAALYRSGVAFVEPSPHTASAIVNFVAAIRNTRS